MSTYPESLEIMLAAWNEADPEKVRFHLEQALVTNVHFVDPNFDIIGIDAFENMVHAVQKKIPGAVYSHASLPDSHHNLYRYYWAIHHNDKLIMPGFDVTEINDAGKIVNVFGFFGKLDNNLTRIK
jgi:hypothetical protein